jgi:hypothetical protein
MGDVFMSSCETTPRDCDRFTASAVQVEPSRSTAVAPMGGQADRGYVARLALRLADGGFLYVSPSISITCA